MTIDESTLLGGITGVLERPGARLVYETTGEGPAVVLIHGFGLTRAPIDVLEGVAGPVLVAVGERDVPGFREMSAVLARRIPGAIYRVVADAGHMINMEQPAAVNELLTRFMLQDASWNR